MFREALVAALLRFLAMFESGGASGVLQVAKLRGSCESLLGGIAWEINLSTSLRNFKI